MEVLKTKEQEVPVSDEGPCGVCGVLSHQQCVRCRNVYYCSKTHQKEDWKSHKESCHPVQMVEIGGGQRGQGDGPKKLWTLVATRDIPQGEIIFKEKPLLTGPRVDDLENGFFAGNSKKFPLCLDCYRVVPGRYKCSKCSWPLCGPSCENGKMHSAFECGIFASRKVPPIERHEDFQYLSVGILRGLLLKGVDPKKWEKFCQLDAKIEEREARDGSFDICFSYAIDFIREECGQMQWSLEEMDFVAGALQINRKSNELSATVINAPFGSYTYHKASFAPHSCVPNAMWFIQKNQDLHLRASVPISRGSEVTTASVQLEDGTFTRRAALALHFISCACPRCEDPTELGTYMSGIKCPNPSCTSGYYLMENPLCPDTSWRCGNSACGRVETSSKISGLLYKIQAEYDGIEKEWSEQPDKNGLPSHLKRIKAEEQFLKRHEGKTLHKNHSILFRCKKMLGYLIPQIAIHVENEVERMVMEEKQVGWVRQCLELANVFWPGYSRYRGHLLYTLQRGLFCLIFSEIETLSRSRRGPNYNIPRMAVLRASFLEVLRIRKEVKIILEIESEGQVEREHALEMDSEGVDFDMVRRVLHLPLGSEQF